MTIKVAGKDEEFKTVVEIDEKSNWGRFTILCNYVGFATLVGMSIKMTVKLIKKITKKGE